MIILGFSAYYHDSAACIIKNGEILAAAQEERFTRIKHDASFPSNCIKFCIDELNITPNDIDAIVFYEKPFLKFERLIESYLSKAPKGFRSFRLAMPLWIKEKLFQKQLIINELNKILNENINWKERLFFSDHHLSHAASAFYPSPFNNAAILTIDGVGEWTTTSIAVGRGNKIDVVKEINFPHSIGLLYSAFTQYLGFKVNSGEYKVMGLAPYGNPIYTDIIKKNLINIKQDGSFQLDMKFFDYISGLKMINKKFENLFAHPTRKSESKLTKFHMDIASSIQKIIEDIVIKLGTHIIEETGQKNLCLAGGVALNCVANGKLNEEKLFDNIWIQPAAGDAGGAIGAALSFWHIHHRKKRKFNLKKDGMSGSFLGPSFQNFEVKNYLQSVNAKFYELSNQDLVEKVSYELSKNKAIGWMQGKMEFGPRALGNRSIIADPRSPDMQKILNKKVKFRESFRPFAPSVLKEFSHKWFEQNFESPYMLFVSKLKKSKCIKMNEIEKRFFGIKKLNVKRSNVPAITHVDYSARIQTVDRSDNLLYYKLIKSFYKRTNIPMIINTSFNVRGEPIVCSPEDAFKCFMATNLDILVINNFILYKTQQDIRQKFNYISSYDLD